MRQKGGTGAAKWGSLGVCATLIALAACFRSDVLTAPVEKPSLLTGRWAGTDAVYSLPFRLNLAEHRGNVLAVGTLGTQIFGILPMSGQGVFVAPNLTLNLSPGGQFATVNYTAVLAGDSLSGALNGAGFINEAFVLKRLP